jgi:hypothetical protein
MDDRALVYRGADQPDMSVINPESDVWQHIKVGGVCISISTLTGSIFRFHNVIWQPIGLFDTLLSVATAG